MSSDGSGLRSRSAWQVRMLLSGRCAASYRNTMVPEGRRHATPRAAEEPAMGKGLEPGADRPAPAGRLSDDETMRISHEVTDAGAPHLRKPGMI